MIGHVIAGVGRALSEACETAEGLGLEYHKLELDSSDGFHFDIQALLQRYAREHVRVFVAIDHRGVNTSRQQLIMQVRMAGYGQFNLVSADALVCPQAVLKGNIHIGAGCTVAPGCEIGMGAWLSRRVVLERDVRLGAFVSLMAGVVLDDGVRVGNGSTLSAGTHGGTNCVVGRQCEWMLGGKLPANLPDRSFFDPLMPEGARVL